MLIHRGIEFRRVHDIAYLMTLLPPEIDTPPEAEKIAALTSYAVMFRYPGAYEDVTAEECSWALAAARIVYDWAERIVGSSYSE